VLNWAITFFLIAVVAALVGFSGVAAGAATVAKIIFALFLTLFVAFLVIGLMRR
jgi:uncharacterized membrane protein YtjA (UPF0391 family)